MKPMITDWTFGGTRAYTPRWFNSADGRIHYVDEGPRTGRPVIMVHVVIWQCMVPWRKCGGGPRRSEVSVRVDG